MLDMLARRVNMRKRPLIMAIRTQTKLIVLRRPFHHTAKWLQSAQNLSWNQLFTVSSIIQTRDTSPTCLGRLRKQRVPSRASQPDVTARQTRIAFADRSSSLQISIQQTDLQWNETSGARLSITRKRKPDFAQFKCASAQSLLFRHCPCPSNVATTVGPSAQPPRTLVFTPTRSTENGYMTLVPLRVSSAGKNSQLTRKRAPTVSHHKSSLQEMGHMYVHWQWTAAFPSLAFAKYSL